MNHLQLQVSAGIFAVTWNSQGLLTRIDWYDNPPGSAAASSLSNSWSVLSRVGVPPVLCNLLVRFQSYFESGTPIGDIPWDQIDSGLWTDFQRNVYQAIAQIPHGETRTYAWVAKRVGQGLATRAVGQALRKNPLPILIPCHRVVSSGALGGFMGAVDPDEPEMRLKRWLIEVESSWLNPTFGFLGETLEFPRPLTGALDLEGFSSGNDLFDQSPQSSSESAVAPQAIR